MCKQRVGLACLVWAGLGLIWAAWASAESVLAPSEDSLGRPVAYVLLADSKAGESPFEDLKKADAKQQRYLIAYKGIAMLDRNTEHPILVFQGFNTKLNQGVKVYLNWDQVVGIQIIDPKVAF